MRTPPNEIRAFVHGRIKRAIGGFVTGGPAGAALGFASGGGTTRSRKKKMPVLISRTSLAPITRAVATHPHGKHGIFHPPWWPQPAGHTGPILGAAVATAPVVTRHIPAPLTVTPTPVAPVVRRPVSRTLTARPSAVSAAEKAAGKVAKFGVGDIVDIALGGGGPGDCGFGRVWDEVRGKCVFGLGEQPGPDDTPIGAVVMGRYGAGERPGNMVVNRAVCRPGMVIGDDGICYNRSQLKNSEHEWPRGRRPLLTGGDMRAISTAARAGRRLERTTKRLQKIGMMKKPAPRARRLPAHQHQITSGG